MKIIYTVIAAFILCYSAKAQVGREWATYYGGTDIETTTGLSATDASGNVYLAGSTQSSSGIASGGFQNVLGGEYDAYISKFDSDGNLIWATYYGGSGTEECYGLAVDPDGNVILSGRTTSTSGIASGGFQNVHNGGTTDAFLVKFNSDGARLWATYYGGNTGEATILLCNDNDGNLYLAGTTSSSTNIASGGFQNTYGGGGNDAFLVKFDPDGVRQWATYYGGSDSDGFQGICTDMSGNVYGCGSTASTNAIASGGFQNTYAAQTDAFLVKFNTNGNRQWATYYGGAAGDVGWDVCTDPSGNVYMAGNAGSTNLAFNGFQNTKNAATDAFLVKFNTNGNRQWATYYGGPDAEGISKTHADLFGNVFLGGVTGSTSDIASSGLQNSFGGGSNDAYLVRFDSDGNRLSATYYGGTESDDVRDISSDLNGNIYLSGLTTSPNGIAFNGYKNTFSGGVWQDHYLAKFGNCLALPTSPGSISGNSTVCSGSSNTYSVAAVSGATSYTWTLPSGWSGASTTNSITTTANTSGGNITVTANNACGSSNTESLAISVNSIPATPGSISGITSICNGSSNTYSVAAVAGATSYTWTLPGGWSGTSTTNSITATASATDGNVTVTANNTCGNSSAASLALVSDNTIPATPGSISGSTSICSGSSNTYNVAAVAGATSYTWTLPLGWSGTSTTNSITTTANATGGNITVTASNACGTSAPRNLALTINTIPSTPGAITGNTAVCLGSSNTYSITAVAGATSYTWTLPSGWSGTSATNSITATAGSSNGNITVTANNTCGNSAASTITILSVLTTPVNPGTISGSASICNGTNNTYSILPTGDASTYNWTLPSGWSGSSTNSSINASATSTGGVISVTGTNICGTSTVSNLTITVNTAPATPGSISGNTTICENSSNNYSITAVGGATAYTWTLPSGWSGTSLTNSITATSNDSGGTITVTADNICGISSSSTLTIIVNGLPTVSYIQDPNLVCISSTSVALGTVSPTGGTFTGTAVNGSIFNPSVAGSGTFTITYTFTDANDCSNTAIQDIVVDPCLGVEENSTSAEIQIYPSPTSGIFTLESQLLKNSNSSISIYNVLGETIYSVNTSSVKNQFDLSNVKSGLYFIEIKMDKGTITNKIIKE